MHHLHVVRSGDVRDHGRQIEFEFNGVMGSGAPSQQSVLVPLFNLARRVSRVCHAASSHCSALEPASPAARQVEREDAGKRPPLGGHVGYGSCVGPCSGRRCRHPDELDGMIQDLVVVEDAAQRDDHVLADDARAEASPVSSTLAIWGTCHHVSPVAPDGGCIGPYDRCAEGRRSRRRCWNVNRSRRPWSRALRSRVRS